MIIEYTQSLLNEQTSSEDEKKFVVSKLFKYRNDFYAYLTILKEQDGSRKSRENVTELIFCLSNSLADLLRTFSFWTDAR